MSQIALSGNAGQMASFMTSDLPSQSGLVAI